MDVEPAARKHGVTDDDMLHTLRHHWRAFETDDPQVTMFIGPSRAGEPLEVGVVEDDEGVAVIHAMAARELVLEGLVESMSATRTARAKALEAWADTVEPGDLVVADTSSLRAIAELAERREQLDAEIVEAIQSARRADRSWSEIGAMLGVSKQAAQRKYAKVAR